MIFQPDEIISVVYNISDPNDSTTYYVQAILRDTNTGATISTANLTGSGRRFSGTFRAPFVNAGNMRLVDVTVTVYTDAGYTTKSDSYQEENFPYQIAERWSQMFLAGMGGPGRLTKKDVEEIVKEQLRLFGLTLDFSPEIKVESIVEMEAFLEQIAIVLTKFDGISKILTDGFSGIDIPKYDYSKMSTELADIRDKVISSMGEKMLEMSKIVNVDQEKVRVGILENVKLDVEKLLKKLGGMNFSIPLSLLETPKEVYVPTASELRKEGKIR